ncbi:SDR family NAD(P)-dependent oxidoreductase [Rhizobium chutanense]|uniref:SDR family NAD(P)-dependent oxidoreductase n=1 Tax=Rhizobium chutanense TaxID=2035448 RepID=A0A3S0QLG2_9HYPH|nr:SDR family NAD(P)-dependent oxidoreductase [Rhizobium chutanense]RUM06194.1 SDR family NAD(P)-dependent oxidoreductase [Rhizobium chutanense]
MHDKPVALITGANKGIGLQIAKDLGQRGFTVLVGSRRLEAGETAAESVARDARPIQLDVTDHASIAAAASLIRKTYGRLDVLVNNAGVSHAGPQNRTAEQIIGETYLSVVRMNELRAVYETNVFGVVAVTQAMLPLLRAAPAGRIVNVSSETGSLSLNADPLHPLRPYAGTYSSSKTALNAVTQAFAIELEKTNIRVNAVCPGFTATDNNKFLGPGTVEEAAREPVRVALLGDESPTGGFSNAHGPLPW